MEPTVQLIFFIFILTSFGFPANTMLFATGSSVQYEVQRRRVESTARGLRDYVAELVMKNTFNGENLTFKAFFRSFNERISMLLLDLQKLWAVDGWAAWRGAEAAEATHLVRRRLRALQHPPRCARARKLVCKVEQPACEFGCQLDHLVFCLSLAYGTRRTLVLDSRGWRYHARGWGQVFQPLSENCTDYDSNDLNALQFASGKETEKVLAISKLNKIARAGMFMPTTIPSDLADRIVRFAGDPSAWWVGQLLAYILRPREYLAAAIARTKYRLHYHKPIVGLQIRRTDKIELHEMIYHSMEEYIFFAENYYWVSQKLMFNTTVRRVYLATEDPRVLLEARRKFRSVQFISEPGARVRSQPAALPPLLTDITLLAAADFVVCTLSSHVCSTAYALMQNSRPDDVGALHSLDEVFYLDDMRPLDRIAVAYHTPSSFEEIELIPGDPIVVSNYCMPIQGLGVGFNTRTKQKGKFPWFKTMDTILVHTFPTYDEDPLCVGECYPTGSLNGISEETPPSASLERASPNGTLERVPPNCTLEGVPPNVTLQEELLTSSFERAPLNGTLAGAALFTSSALPSPASSQAGSTSDATASTSSDDEYPDL